MQEKIDLFKRHVREASANPDFSHHKWFIKWHLEIVEQIARELTGHYPEADNGLVEVTAWLHDYGKVLCADDQYAATLQRGHEKLTELGFEPEFVARAVSGIEILDKKMELDLHEAPIEVQIISSADACSHMVGPFMNLWWSDNPDKSVEELMEGHRKKADKDWNRKIVLPEARAAFEQRYRHICEEAGELPAKYL